MCFKACLVVVAAALLFPILRTVIRLSCNHHRFKHHPHTCRVIDRKTFGSEDLQVLPSGLAFITSGLTYQACSAEFEAFSKSKGKGQIEMFDMNSSNLETKILRIKHGKDFNPDTFRPHGLSVLEDKVKGQHLLYVINHSEKDVDRVEKFKFLPATKELQHMASFFSELFRVTNDLAVLEEDKFYVSNFIYTANHMLSALEQIYRIPLCSVVFFSGTNASIVVDKLNGPNGVTLSKDRRYLYVSFPDEEMVRVYRRHSDEDLVQVQEVALHTSPDNLHLSEDGHSLLGGCHPDARNVAFHLLDPVNRSPSQVLRLPLKDGLVVEEEITEEFYDRGDLITGSTVAGVFKNKMIVGSIIDALVLCQLTGR